MNDTLPVLYILMRTDLASMNAGKAMAQASHASNTFVYEVNALDEEDPVWDLGQKWQAETDQYFGTVLVLAVNEQQMRFSVEAAKRYGKVADVINDPTYPLRDGDTTHFLPLDTCGYIFCDKNDPITGMLLGGYKLHP